MSIGVQIQTVLSMSVCGLLMGMGYDTYQVFRGRGRFPAWLVFLLDVLFWLVSVGFVFWILAYVNNGVVRFPIFIGLFGGAWLYFLLGSKQYVQFLQAAIRFTQWLFRTVMLIIDTLIVRPILFIYRLIGMLISFLITIILGIFQFCWRILQIPIAPVQKWGHNVGRKIHRRGKGFWADVKKWIRPRNKQE